MVRDLWRDKFDASKELVARRPFAAGDTSLAPGDVVPQAVISPRRLRQLYDSRVVVHKDVWDELHGEPTQIPAASVVKDIDALRIEAEALGIEVDKRWGEKRLLKEIEDHGESA